MKSLIQALFSTKKKQNRRSKAVFGASSDQFAKMGKLGQQLVVMSR